MTWQRVIKNGRPEIESGSWEEARSWDRWSDERGGHDNAEFGDYVLDGTKEAGAGVVEGGKGLIGFLPNLLMYNVLGIDKDFWDPTLSFSDVGQGWKGITDFNFRTNPLLRPFDSMAQIVYGGADMATGHLPYTILNETLGLDIPYLTPSPETVEDAVAEVVTLAAMALFGARAAKGRGSPAMEPVRTAGEPVQPESPLPSPSPKVNPNNRPLPSWKQIESEGPSVRDSYSKYDRRRKFTSDYAWAVPSPAAIDAIAGFAHGRPVLEVGAGRGLWAALLKEQGAEVIATDGYCSHGMETILPHQRSLETYMDVEALSHVEAVARYGDRDTVLMTVWPPLEDPMAAGALEAFERKGGERLVVVGEGRGGCTGDDAFWGRLEKGWDEVDYVDIPKWFGIYDGLTLYVRRPSTTPPRQPASPLPPFRSDPQSTVRAGDFELTAETGDFVRVEDLPPAVREGLTGKVPETARRVGQGDPMFDGQGNIFVDGHWRKMTRPEEVALEKLTTRAAGVLERKYEGSRIMPRGTFFGSIGMHDGQGNVLDVNGWRPLTAKELAGWGELLKDRSR